MAWDVSAHLIIPQVSQASRDSFWFVVFNICCWDMLGLKVFILKKKHRYTLPHVRPTVRPQGVYFKDVFHVAKP